MITIVVAMDENNAIGYKNKLLWHLPDDLIHFKKLTQNHPIIMGRKTYESIGKPLPNRTNIIISRNNIKETQNENLIYVDSLEKAIEIGEKKNDSLFIIGGGKIYLESINICDKIELTLVHTKIEDADTYFPSIDLKKWKTSKEAYHPKDERHSFDFTFITYYKG